MVASVLESSTKPLVASFVVDIAAVAVTSWYTAFSRAKRQSLPDGTTRPPHIQTMLPFLGSAIEMGADITSFIRKYRDKYNSPVFTATIMGEKCVFLADSELVNTVFKSTFLKYLDSRSLQKKFVSNVLAFDEESSHHSFNNPEVGKVAGAQFTQFLFKGEELSSNMKKVQTFFREIMPTLASSDEWVTHDLYRSTVSAIFKASVGPLLSTTLVTDQALEHFRTFDQGVIPLFNNLPAFLTKSARASREFLSMQLESNEFSENSSNFMKARKEALPIPPKVFGKANLGVLWASTGNSAPAVFWTIFLLLEHPKAYTACRDQVDQVGGTEKKDWTLDDLDRLTLLESAFREALRLYSGNFTSRDVVKDFVLETSKGKYFIEKGTRLMSWWGLLHSDPAIFDEPEEYRFDRFVDMESKSWTYASGKKLTHSPVMSFGGGSHLCPGRKFISYEVRLLLAMMLQNFDLRIPNGETRPGINLAMQGIGISQPDRDPKVEIRQRQV